MSLDEEIQKLKREGADPAKIIIAKVRAGILTTKLVSYATSLGNQDAAIAISRLGLASREINQWLESARQRENIIKNVLTAAAKIAPEPKPKNLLRRLYVSYVCDVADHVMPWFNEVYPEDERPRTAIGLARRFAAGEKFGNGITIYSDVMFMASRESSRAFWEANNLDVARVASVASFAAQICYVEANMLPHTASVACYEALEATSDRISVLLNQIEWQRSRLAQYALGEI